MITLMSPGMRSTFTPHARSGRLAATWSAAPRAGPDARHATRAVVRDPATAGAIRSDSTRET
jgi:hypothetical protein